MKGVVERMTRSNRAPSELADYSHRSACSRFIQIRSEQCHRVPQTKPLDPLLARGDRRIDASSTPFPWAPSYRLSLPPQARLWSPLAVLARSSATIRPYASKIASDREEWAELIWTGRNELIWRRRGGAFRKFTCRSVAGLGPACWRGIGQRGSDQFRTSRV
jgi:hypothetical protein